MSDFNSSLPIRTETSGDVAVKVVDRLTPSQGLAVDTNGHVTSNLADGSGNAVSSQANGAQRALDVGINVAGVQVDPRSIRALTTTDAVTANIKDSAGASITVGQKTSAASIPVVISSDQTPIPVSISASLAGTEINDFNTGVAIGLNGTSNHDYVITAGKTLRAKKFQASASGRMKIEIQISPDGVTFTTKFVAFNSSTTPNVDIDMDLLSVSDSGAGAKVRIIRTNLDKVPMDVYSTICGLEV